MSTKIHTASISGNEISHQVHELDIAQTRVEKVLSQVTLMLDLKETISRVEECINDKKYDIAAQETYRILHDTQNINSENDIKEIDEVSYVVLEDLEGRLKKLIMEECKKAADENRLPDVIKYCSLYPYLGNDTKKKGLEIYCDAIKKELRWNCQEQNLTLDSQVSDSIINYVSTIEKYIDMIITTATDNEIELKNKFNGIDVYPILKLVQILHSEADLELSKLLNHYLKTNEIDKLVSKISEYNSIQHSNLVLNKGINKGEELIEKFNEMKDITAIQVLDKILDEISHISQELMAYDTTMRELTNEEIKEEYKKENDRVFRMSKINTIRTRLTGDYIMLEQFNMIYQIYRVLIEENNNIEHNINISVEDYKCSLSGNIYYLLKTLAIRSFNTYDINVSCAIINNICNSLESIYKEWLDKKLRQQPGQTDSTNIAQQLYRSTSKYIGTNTLLDTNNLLHNKKLIILLNTIDESVSDTNLIMNQLEQEVNEIFCDCSEKDKFKIRQTLKGFDDICKSFERIIDRGIKLYSNGFEKIFLLSLNRFKQYDFEIKDENEFKKRDNNNNNNKNNNDEMGGGNGSFVEILIQSSRPTFYALSKRLTNINFDRILIKMLSYYLGELERFVLNHKFTFWGGMKFDQYRQEMQSYFSELTSTRSIRDQFIRIRCITEILQFSNINESVNYLNDDIINLSNISNNNITSDQSLTVDEIKKK
eukprot:264089_1